MSDVCSFLGMCSYYRLYVSCFVDIASPLHALTDKNVLFRLSETCQAAFVRLKEIMITAPGLYMPADNNIYVLDTDVSDLAIGPCSPSCGTEKKGSFHMLIKHYKAEKNYCMTQKEWLAVVHFMKQFEQYLLGAD